MKQQETAISNNLKEIREQRNLSLDQLAELTGVSKSMLRQIETGRSSPTIATIWKIANGLRLSFTTLVSKRHPDVAIMDFKGSKPLTAKSERYRLFPLTPFDPEHAFEIYYVEIEPKTTFEGEPHEGNVEEYVFVMQGRLEITVEENHYSVNANQFIRFIANRPHKYFSAGKEKVSAIMMICYLG
jgi:transcriptional regulator with XRE-family HTH domain